MKLTPMKKIFTAVLALAAMGIGSCTDDLNQTPVIETDATKVYSKPDGYLSVMAKIYGGFTLVGQEKGGGNADLSSLKGQDLIRCLFNLQELPTDEAAYRWGSGDNTDGLSYMSWDANDMWVSDVYYRLYYNIALCNEFLRYCDDAHIGGFPQADQDNIRGYAEEVRFMRAFNYYWVLDLFRQGPYVDENTPSSGYTPERYDAKQLFDYIDSELADIQLPATNEYGRANSYALAALKSRLYLNAQSYIGEARYTECISACKEVLAGGYSLESDRAKVFNGDNHKRTNEIIFAFVVDGTNSMTWGGTTYLVNGSVANDNDFMKPTDYGIETGWGNFRVHGELVDLFGEGDTRATFFSEGQSKYFTGGLEDGTQGYYSIKYTNLTDDGQPACDPNDGVSTDYPVFRLPEIMLNAAEAVLRGGSGMSRPEALAMVNELRARGYGDDSGNIAESQLTLRFVLDERARELYHELLRRTDLVRYGLFTTSEYVWQWKGGVLDGRAVADKYNYYPVPASELSANPNLSNPEY